ncbi:MAG: carbohydrate porin [Pseudomonadota bacterium]
MQTSKVFSSMFHIGTSAGSMPASTKARWKPARRARDPQGFDGRTAVEGDYTKFTIAPTFKPQVGGFWQRPEIRLFASWSDWDEELKDYSADDAFGSDEFTGSQWTFGVQTEVWF